MTRNDTISLTFLSDKKNKSIFLLSNPPIYIFAHCFHKANIPTLPRTTPPHRYDLISAHLLKEPPDSWCFSLLQYHWLPFHSTKHHPDSKRASLPYLTHLSGTSPSLLPFKAKLSKAETMPVPSCPSAPLFPLLQACYWNFFSTSQWPSCYQSRSLHSQSLNSIQSPELSSSLWLAAGKPCFSFLVPLLWAQRRSRAPLGSFFSFLMTHLCYSRTSNIISKTYISCSTSLLDAGAGCMSDDENVNANERKAAWQNDITRIGLPCTRHHCKFVQSLVSTWWNRCYLPSFFR